MRVERTFAWEDKFKRLLLRFERIQQRHYGMKLLAYTLINLRTRIKRLVRRTLCFSKTEHMHDLVIGLFINRYEFGQSL